MFSTFEECSKGFNGIQIRIQLRPQSNSNLKCAKKNIVFIFLVRLMKNKKFETRIKKLDF